MTVPNTDAQYFPRTCRTPSAITSIPDGRCIGRSRSADFTSLALCRACNVLCTVHIGLSSCRERAASPSIHGLQHECSMWERLLQRAHRQPSKPTWLRSQDIHSQRSLFTKGCAWSMLGAALKQSPDAGPPATQLWALLTLCTASRSVPQVHNQYDRQCLADILDCESQERPRLGKYLIGPGSSHMSALGQESATIMHFARRPPRLWGCMRQLLYTLSPPESCVAPLNGTITFS